MTSHLRKGGRHKLVMASFDTTSSWVDMTSSSPPQTVGSPVQLADDPIVSHQAETTTDAAGLDEDVKAIITAQDLRLSHPVFEILHLRMAAGITSSMRVHISSQMTIPSRNART